MKVKYYELLKIILYTIIGLLLVISSYLIIINIRHYKSLSGSTIVSEADSDYSQYKDNINSIEEKLNKYSNKDDEKYLSLIKILDSMKKDGVFRLIPKSKLNYKDLYQLNDYYIEELINNNWIKNMQELDIGKKYYDYVLILANNSNYLNSVFTNNSLVLYDGKLDNQIDNNYRFILHNYLSYSNIILDICNELGG